MISLFQILPLENNKDLFNHKLIIKCAVPGTLAITPRRALDKEVDPSIRSFIHSVKISRHIDEIRAN